MLIKTPLLRQSLGPHVFLSFTFSLSLYSWLIPRSAKASCITQGILASFLVSLSHRRLWTTTLRSIKGPQQRSFVFVFSDVHKQGCFTVNVTICHPELRQGSLPLLHECQACSYLEDWWFPEQQGIASLTQHFHIWKQDCFINKEKVEIKKRNVIKSVDRLVQENIWGTLWSFL